jgi:adenylate cyclase
MKMQTGVLFADLRGFTAQSEGSDPEVVSKVLRRFYRCAEDVLFPEAIIDKLIGDEVMALYLPEVQLRFDVEEVPALMLEHARGLLRAVGYGSGRPPFVEMGIGMDLGEAFVGNIGERALYDFTAVGDVVNTASRLQGEAAGGEVVLSERVAEGLPEPVGRRDELMLKGKSEPQVAYRVTT